MPDKVFIDLEELLNKARCMDAYFQIKSIVSGLTYYTQNEGEWISVDERLPENNAHVLAYNGEIHEYTYDHKERWWTLDEGWYYTTEIGITHWMPLPEVPKMKGGTE